MKASRELLSVPPPTPTGGAPNHGQTPCTCYWVDLGFSLLGHLWPEIWGSLFVTKVTSWQETCRRAPGKAIFKNRKVYWREALGRRVQGLGDSTFIWQVIEGPDLEQSISF